MTQPLLGSGTLNAGVATYLHSTLAAGSHASTAAYAGDSFDSGSTSPVFTQTVGLATPSVRIKSSPNPSTFGQEVNFTATVLSPGGVTGSVSFYRNSRLLGTAGLAGDSANFELSALPVGESPITASYSGDANNQPGTSRVLTQDVRDPTQTTLNSSPNPSSVGQAILLTATVTPTGVSGQVNFFKGSTSLGKATVSGGTATLSVSTLPAGEHELTANFSGSATYGPSKSSVVFQVVKQ